MLFAIIRTLIIKCGKFHMCELCNKYLKLCNGHDSINSEFYNIQKSPKFLAPLIRETVFYQEVRKLMISNGHKPLALSDKIVR